MDPDSGNRAPSYLTKSDYAYGELRRRILEGELAPGTVLQLRPMAEELGLSVMPVRDAIRLLQRDGLVATQTHRSAVVTTISGEDVIQAISIRMWLEILAIREATPRHTGTSISEVERTLVETERLSKSGDGLAYSHANRALHEALEAPAPTEIRQLIEDLWDRLWQERRRMSLFVLAPERIPGAEAEHRQIFQAVRRKDDKRAAAAMARHRDSSLAAWEAALEHMRSS
jgi:DNA-binding GntR family transcriptional regulator